MLVDEVRLRLRAGHGGAGRVSFFVHQRGPDGGDGGKGGDLYIETTTDLSVLRNYSNKKEISAPDGKMGSKNKKSGEKGEDTIVYFPVGSVLTDKETGEVIELTEPNLKMLLCKGGLGGRGNFALRSPRRTTPLYAQKGLPGEERDLLIHLKLIADFGLIGLPNAGKSSLLNTLTSANAKVGDYSFTTLEPNLGMLKTSRDAKILADIPGLIEGAAEGKGLGIKFLKHIEKTSILLHCLDASSIDPMGDYLAVRSELSKYNKEMLNKEEIVLLTKSDLLDDSRKKALLKGISRIKSKKLFVSVLDEESIKSLRKLLED